MSAVTPALPARPVPAGRSPGTVVARLTARRASVQSAVWGLVFGALVVTTVSGFVTVYPTAADRLRLRVTVAGNAGAEALLGPTRRIDTVAGWTAWRAVGLAMLIGAIWALLAGTRFLRGEEEAGRWELLLTGATTRGRAAAQALVGLGVALAVMFVVTAGIAVVEGRSHDARSRSAAPCSSRSPWSPRPRCSSWSARSRASSRRRGGGPQVSPRARSASASSCAWSRPRSRVSAGCTG